MSKSHGSKNQGKRHNVGPKTTETNEADPSMNKNTIEAAFYRQLLNQWRSHKSTCENLQTLVWPKYQSTPMKSVIRNEVTEPDCEILIDDVTPIKVSSRDVRSFNEESDTQKELACRMSKSDGNSLPGICSSPSTRKMLSLDETLLKSIDLDSFEDNPREVDKETSSMPPPLPVRIEKTKPSKFPENTQTTITVTADVHHQDLSRINIDNWGNDSFMDGVLRRNKNISDNQSLSDVNKNIPDFKRPIICDNRSPVLRKRLKETNAIANERQENHTNINKEAEQNVEVYHSEVNTGDKNELMKKNFRSLSVGEKVRRMLVTNAQKPVISRHKLTDSLSSAAAAADLTDSFNELGPFFGLPSKVKTLFEQNKGISQLYEWQEECLNLQAVQEKTNLVYALPTSGGKTLVAEILLLREVLCSQKNALFVLPYVAIVQEKVHSLSPFAFELGFLVEEYAAGKGKLPPKKHRHKQSVYVATIEKAYSLINSLMENKRLSEIGLVIVDELHLLGEDGRGATLECLLALLLFSSESIHIVGMSATIGNMEEIAKFLHAEIYRSNFRPVELKEYVKCEDTLYAVTYKEEEMFTQVRTVNPPYNDYMKKNDPDKICSLVLEVIPEFSCLVFCATKSACENIASKFAQIMSRELLDHKREEKSALLRALFNAGRGVACPILQNSVPFGVAYHHSGLTGDERRLLEEAYRIGTLCCICCTSTLAAGVNLPAKRVILRSPYVGCKFISHSQYKQMVGRAGRAGFDVAGESILMCQNRDMAQVKSLLTSQMDGASSRLHVSESRGLQSLVLGCIGLGIATSRRELHKMVTCTLLYVQRKKLKVEPKKLVDKTVSKLFKLGGLRVNIPLMNFSCRTGYELNDSTSSEQVDHILNITDPAVMQSNVAASGSVSKSKHPEIYLSTGLKVSQLGIAAMKGSLDLNRAKELYKDLLRAQASFVLLSHLHILYLVTPYDMMDKIKIDHAHYFHVYNELNERDRQAANIIGVTNACIVKIFRGSRSNCVSERVVHRFYITLILNDLWNHCDVWDVSRKYNIPRGTIQALMVSSSSFASSVLHFCEEMPEFWAFKELLGCFSQRLSHCCSPDLAPLMDLPAVKLGRARQLYSAGYKTLLDIANANASALVSSIDHMPRKVAHEIIAAANLLLLTKADNLREEAEDLLDGLFGKARLDYQD